MIVEFNMSCNGLIRQSLLPVTEESTEVFAIRMKLGVPRVQ